MTTVPSGFFSGPQGLFTSKLWILTVFACVWKLLVTGKNLVEMQSALDITANQFALLKTIELEAACQLIARIISSLAKPDAVGVLLWDPDFEAFSEHAQFAFGKNSEAMEQLLSDLASAEFDWDETEPASPNGNGTVEATESTLSIDDCICHRLKLNGQPIALLLVAGDSSLTQESLEQDLSHYELATALANCWEVAELRREVDRLREQYELLETDFHEEKKLNAETGHRQGNASFRLEQSDKEKLVYEISNAVRSSLDIQEVLQTAVQKIALTFVLSRCLVIWPMPDSDQYSVYEYHHEQLLPVEQVFFTPLGEEFVRVATAKTAPYDFGTTHDDTFDKEFLKVFGMLSGMLVPLIYHDRNIGTLFLQDCMMPREWSIDNTALIGSLADLVTVAIEHANMHEEKKRQAVTDGLTGISNRRHFNDSLSKEFERAKRYGNELSLVVVDLDFLKKINDQFGHHVGDEAIKAIGAVLSKSCRSVDLAARYGGEEFCLLLPDTDNENAVNLAERVRKRISETVVPGAGTISASLGVATYPHHGDSQNALFEAADQALYAAKDGGRNRVVSAEALPKE